MCNVGKHALGVRCIQAIGKEQQGWYILIIKYDGYGISSSQENKGIKQAINLARKLGGHFKRESIFPHGTLCELTWPLATSKGFIRKVIN